MQRTALAPGLLLGLSIAACASFGAQRMKEQASTRLSCPADQITLTPYVDANHPAKASGCGREDSMISHCVTASGSGGTASSCVVLWFSEAVNQAAFTSGCPKEQVKTQWMQPTLGVDACGQRMTYSASLSGWILNSSGGTAAPAPTDAPRP